jgi:hypothetical protein
MLLRRRRFEARLGAIAARLSTLPPSAASGTSPPPEVRALATRLGAGRDKPPLFVELEQSGSMWRAPGRKAMGFTARQTIATHAPGFLWRAVMDPLRSVLVADWLEGGHGGLEAKLFGALPVATLAASPAIDQGEILRYLAELAWNPDAMLANAALAWTVVDARTIIVAAGNGAARGEVTFLLDETGLIASISAPSRVYAQGASSERRPWHGRFWDYRTIDGYLIPFQGEVGWTLDAGEFVYWRGALTSWRAAAAS